MKKMKFPQKWIYRWEATTIQMTKTSIAKPINMTMMMPMTLNMTMMKMLRPAVESVEVLTIFYESPRYVHCVRPTPTWLNDNDEDDNKMQIIVESWANLTALVLAASTVNEIGRCPQGCRRWSDTFDRLEMAKIPYGPWGKTQWKLDPVKKSDNWCKQGNQNIRIQNIRITCNPWGQTASRRHISPLWRAALPESFPVWSKKNL